METTRNITKQQAIWNVLERNIGKWVKSYKLIYPFSSDDKRAWCLEHRKPLTMYRRRHPGMQIVNKKHIVDGEYKSYYRLDAKDVDLDEEWDKYLASSVL